MSRRTSNCAADEGGASCQGIDGLPRRVDDGSQTSRFGYDGLGSVSARYQLADTGSNPVATDYVYGDAELATQMAWSGVPTNSTFYAYDQDGRPQTQTMPNGEQLSWVFNPDNTLQQQTLSSAPTGGSTLAQYTYAYNADYLVTQQEFTGGGANNATPYQQTLCFGYDAADRVNTTYTASLGTACGSAPAANVSWDHDGNRLAYTPLGASQATTFTYNADNSIATSTAGSTSSSFAYTGAGETHSDGCLGYVYDGFGRVTQANPSNAAGCSGVTQASYTYDVKSRRFPGHLNDGNARRSCCFCQEHRGGHAATSALSRARAAAGERWSCFATSHSRL